MLRFEGKDKCNISDRKYSNQLVQYVLTLRPLLPVGDLDISLT